MAYSKPFTPQQRREAMQALRSYTKHLRLLRRRYSPADAEQSSLLDDYATVIEEIQALLAKLDRAVNVTRLNKLDATARWLAMEYWRLQSVES